MLNTHIARQIYAKISFETTFSQKKVVEMLSEWLSSPDYSQIFVLNGYAGTGKTTLISVWWMFWLIWEQSAYCLPQRVVRQKSYHDIRIVRRSQYTKKYIGKGQMPITNRSFH